LRDSKFTPSVKFSLLSCVKEGLHRPAIVNKMKTDFKLSSGSVSNYIKNLKIEGLVLEIVGSFPKIYKLTPLGNQEWNRLKTEFQIDEKLAGGPRLDQKIEDPDNGNLVSLQRFSVKHKIIQDSPLNFPGQEVPLNNWVKKYVYLDGLRIEKNTGCIEIFINELLGYDPQRLVTIALSKCGLAAQWLCDHWKYELGPAQFNRKYELELKHCSVAEFLKNSPFSYVPGQMDKSTFGGEYVFESIEDLVGFKYMPQALSIALRNQDDAKRERLELWKKHREVNEKIDLLSETVLNKLKLDYPQLFKEGLLEPNGGQKKEDNGVDDDPKKKWENDMAYM